MKSILSIFVASIFIASQVGLSISTHYCGGEISEQSFGLVYHDLSCGMEDESASTCSSNEQEIKGNCCDNNLQSFVNTEKFEVETKEIDFKQHFTLAIAISFSELIPTQSNALIRSFEFIPPPLTRDIPVLIQSFLI